MGASAVGDHLEEAFSWLVGPSTPPRLHAAMRHAVFGGGSRVRPRLVMAVFRACQRGDETVAAAAAASIELLHCASLVHDDLPCFDDAPMRRGLPAVHVAYSEELAVLTGDALIAGAFEVLGRGCASNPSLLGPLLATVARGAGAIGGIVAGQGWESEREPDLVAYHRAKTGALFEAAVCAGAIAGGGDPARWCPVGTRLGEAYQVADDILDQVGSSALLGKPVGQDARNNRPSIALELGLEEAYTRWDQACNAMFTCVPVTAGRGEFVQWLMALCNRILPAPQAHSVSRTSTELAV